MKFINKTFLIYLNPLYVRELEEYLNIKSDFKDTKILILNSQKKYVLKSEYNTKYIDSLTKEELKNYLLINDRIIVIVDDSKNLSQEFIDLFDISYNIINHSNFVFKENILLVEKLELKEFNFNYKWLYSIAFILVSVLLIFVFKLDLQILYRSFFSTFLQSLPFLWLGILLSELLKRFISEEFILKLFNFNKFLSYLIAILFGGILPICDCAMVPLSASLAMKKCPKFIIVAFLLSSSSLNPLAIYTSYIAFNSRIDIVVYRIIFSIILAIICSIFFISDRHQMLRIDNINQACSCDNFSEKKSIQLINNVYNEIVEICTYLVLACFGASMIRMIMLESNISLLNTHPILVILFVIIISIFLSLCSSSNSFIARSFLNIIPLYASLAFMILGPVLDIKNMVIIFKKFTVRFSVKYILVLLLCSIILITCLRFVL